MLTGPLVTYPDGVEPPTLDGIIKAHNRIKSHIHRTPLLTSTTLNGLASNVVRGITSSDGRDITLQVALKCENFQKVGAFKARGAMNAVLKYMENEAENEKGTELHLVTHSSGNFAQALAFAAHALTSPQKSIKATIIMSRLASPIKKAGVIGYGARIVDCEPHNRLEICNDEIKRLEAEGKTVAYFPPYDHVDIIEGQGTCMVEVAEQAQDIWGAGTAPDIVLCPIGGGGLMSGVAIASKGYWGEHGVKVVGAEPSGANDAHGSFYSKTWQPAIAPINTVCDGLLTATGNITYPALVANVDDILLAEDESTIRAMKFIWERMKIIIEPSSALAPATILGNELGGPEDSTEWRRIVQQAVLAKIEKGVAGPISLRVVVVISGGNVALTSVLKMFEELEDPKNEPLNADV
ncbi:hypothetical protein QFC22_003271 [Naganishia vaughanmartiniae]|uniref:Uncharacterized protein n=1 Tax=Naganishia vaughanmartiniae TaxID=1424756 RepID=A0ACC2X8F8_9TREE|nr:hypothetical protein QFC22_003271 [Naganishia vaughanmartiniae]